MQGRKSQQRGPSPLQLQNTSLTNVPTRINPTGPYTQKQGCLLSHSVWQGIGVIATLALATFFWFVPHPWFVLQLPFSPAAPSSITQVVRLPTSLPTLSPTSLPTPSPTPAFSYHADWTTGFGDWHVSQQWTHSSDDGGMLIANGSLLNDWIFPSSSVSTTNYRVTAQIDSLSYGQHPSGTAFGIVVRLKSGAGGYVCGIGHSGGAEHAFIALITAPPQGNTYYIQKDIFHSQDFHLDKQWHTYQIDVNSTTITFRLDNQSLGSIDDSTYLGGEQAGIYASYTELQVKGYTISLPGAG